MSPLVLMGSTMQPHLRADVADLFFLVEPSLSVGEHVFIFHKAVKHY